MPLAASPERSKHHRFPAEIISPGVWLYDRLCLSYRDVDELLFVRGLMVTYEAIRRWCRKCGQADAHQLRRRRPRLGDKWHLDEVFLLLNKERHDLGRAVDQDGHVLDIVVQRRRDEKAAQKFLRKRLKGLTYGPSVSITDKRKSYGAAKREMLPGVEHRQHRYLNNRAENSPPPTRQRERRMQGFKSAGHAQRFRAAYGPIAQHFRPRRHRFSALEYRQVMRARYPGWGEITGTGVAASEQLRSKAGPLVSLCCLQTRSPRRSRQYLLDSRIWKYLGLVISFRLMPPNGASRLSLAPFGGRPGRIMSPAQLAELRRTVVHSPRPAGLPADT
jgi:putative transposase